MTHMSNAQRIAAYVASYRSARPGRQRAAIEGHFRKLIKGLSPALRASAMREWRRLTD